MALAPESG